VNIDVKVGDNNFCKSESNFTHDGNIAVNLNLLCALIQKAIIMVVRLFF
jgi:hypothetical protein